MTAPASPSGSAGRRTVSARVPRGPVGVGSACTPSHSHSSSRQQRSTHAIGQECRKWGEEGGGRGERRGGGRGGGGKRKEGAGEGEAREGRGRGESGRGGGGSRGEGGERGGGRGGGGGEGGGEGEGGGGRGGGQRREGRGGGRAGGSGEVGGGGRRWGGDGGEGAGFASESAIRRRAATPSSWPAGRGGGSRHPRRGTAGGRGGQPQAALVGGLYWARTRSTSRCSDGWRFIACHISDHG